MHGVKSVGKGPASGNGSQKINTYIWASWDCAEQFGNGNDLGGKPAGGDIDTFSHEITECLSDPFANNTARPHGFRPWRRTTGASNGSRSPTR